MNPKEIKNLNVNITLSLKNRWLCKGETCDDFIFEILILFK